MGLPRPPGLDVSLASDEVRMPRGEGPCDKVISIPAMNM